MPDALDIALQKLQTEGLPLPKGATAALRQSIYRDAGGTVSQKVIDDAIAKLLAGVKSIAHPTEETRATDDEGGTKEVEVGESQASVRGAFAQTLRQFSSVEEISEALNLNFKIGTAVDVLRGAGRFVSAQTDVDEYPAWELYRLYDRTVPRGFEKGPKGELIENPDDAWPARFKDAITECSDSEQDKAVMLEILDTGRMIALKDSDVWNQLANNRDDTLGNPWPPFAFNSGFDVDGVPVKECYELGLLEDGDKPEGSEIDWDNLISFDE